jgi:hypothetical protein
MTMLSVSRDWSYNRNTRRDEPVPYTFKVVPLTESDCLRIKTGFTDVAIMSVTREDLIACRDAINAHLGEQPQYVCDGCGDLYEPSRQPNPHRQQYCDTCRKDGTAERLRKRSQRARQAEADDAATS